MSDTIATDAQSLEITSGLIDLYELEIGAGTNNILYFYGGKDLDNGNADKDIIFDGKTYIALPVMLEGIEKKGDGAMARPIMTIANVESIVKTGADFKTQMDDGTWDSVWQGETIDGTNFQIEHLIGQRVTRRRTFEKYTGSGVSPFEFPKETFIIDRVSNKTLLFVELELASPMDLAGTRLPRRSVIGKYCPWLYQGYKKGDKGSACFWKVNGQISDANNTYTFYFTVDDEPIVSAALLTGSTNDFWKGAYSSSTTYGSGEYVSQTVSQTDRNTGVSYQETLFWRSEAASNTGNTPSAASVSWQQVRTYTAWSNSTSYTINNESPFPNFKKNPYVSYGDGTGDHSETDPTVTIWRAVAPSTNIAPGTNTSIWVRGDVCGKLLKSCKVRYQGVPRITGNSYDLESSVVHSQLNSSSALPFGGFPGSRKFR